MTLGKISNNAYGQFSSQDELDKHFMKLCLSLAKKAEMAGEVPIGAVIVDQNNKVLAKSGNIREQQSSTLGHAELVVVHRAGKKIGSWRLNGCTLYVTLEPCFMCAGALVQSRISRVVFGAHDPKGGALGSLAELQSHPKLNHKFAVTSGVYKNESSDLLKNFFKTKRKLLKKK